MMGIRVTLLIEIQKAVGFIHDSHRKIVFKRHIKNRQS